MPGSSPVVGTLTPRVGYVVTLSQIVGSRPMAAVDCTRCHFHESVPVEAFDLQTMTPEGLGEPVRVALMQWLAHLADVPSHITEQGEGS